MLLQWRKIVTWSQTSAQHGASADLYNDCSGHCGIACIGLLYCSCSITWAGDLCCVAEPAWSPPWGWVKKSSDSMIHFTAGRHQPCCQLPTWAPACSLCQRQPTACPCARPSATSAWAPPSSQLWWQVAKNKAHVEAKSTNRSLNLRDKAWRACWLWLTVDC